MSRNAIKYIREINLIFKTHLDIGFTDLAQNVTKRYFNDFLPQAIKTADWFRQKNIVPGYTWTVGSWLIYEYLETATAFHRKLIEKAILQGDITWHAMPFTIHSEFLDPSLLKYGLSLSKQLDQRFGHQTIAAKMTDVPGHTRGIIEPLSEAGIKVLHIGINPASMMPHVPQMFLWQDEKGNELLVIYQSDYGDTLLIPELKTAMYMDVTGDNLGPHNPQDAYNIYLRMQKTFPNAKITGVTLDIFAKKLCKLDKATLPIVKEEIGDTWIHGVGSDPRKVSRYRELCRLRNKWLIEYPSAEVTSKIAPFSRKLLLVGEHTWGMDEKTWLDDYQNYSKSDFFILRKTEKARMFERSWQEKRKLLSEAIEALDDNKLIKNAKTAIASTNPHRPKLTSYIQLNSPEIQTHFFDVTFDKKTGAIVFLCDNTKPTIYVQKTNKFGLFQYQTFSTKDYNRFMKQYLRTKPDWAIKDFSKPGLPYRRQNSSYFYPAKVEFYYKRCSSGVRIQVIITMPVEAIRKFGSPKNICIEYFFPKDSKKINIKLQWFDKTACRHPEAIWFSMGFYHLKNNHWLFEKLNSQISPLDVIENGNRTLHAVNEVLYYSDSYKQIKIRTLDAPLVAPGRPSLLNFHNKQPSLEKGVHFNLYNNVWGTNFPMWYEDNGLFRFILEL